MDPWGHRASMGPYGGPSIHVVNTVLLANNQQSNQYCWSAGPLALGPGPLVPGPGPLVLGPGPMVPGPWALVPWSWALVPGPGPCMVPWSRALVQWSQGPGPRALGPPGCSHIGIILTAGQPYRDYAYRGPAISGLSLPRASHTVTPPISPHMLPSPPVPPCSPLLGGPREGSLQWSR